MGLVEDLIEIEVKRGIKHTDEQKELILDFEHDILSNSLPGTGKTETAVSKLILAEKGLVVPGDKITAMSFTRLATAELKDRHKRACKVMRMSQRANFQTLHSICLEIISQNYEKLGLKVFKGTSKLSYKMVCDFLLSSGAEFGINITKSNVSKVKNAIESLNSSLIFDKTHMVIKEAFKKTKLKPEEFTKLRRNMYDLNRATSSISLQDLLLYTLEILLRFPEVSQEQKAKRLLVLFDEFQDANLVQIKILQMISKKLIVIGDINQQIYAFTGACAHIVDKFKEYYPNHKEHHLTQSFRCGEDIAAFARMIIRPNGDLAEAFKGLDGRVSNVVIEPTVDLDVLCARIKDNFVANHNQFEKDKDIMFLYRNNYSAIPICEALFKQNLPFYSDKFVKAYSVPIVEDLVALVNIAKDPYDISEMGVLRKILPEFRSYSQVKDLPIVKAIQASGKSILDINYQFQNERAGDSLMQAIVDVREMYNEKKPTSVLFNRLYPIYNELYLSEYFYVYEQKPEFYTNLVRPLSAIKDFDTFIDDENRKQAHVDEWSNRQSGIRCYTMHGSKGTEAGIVYILDADEDLIPNQRRLDDTVKLGCLVDAAINIRNERSLCFVAATRAKFEVHIMYATKLASLFTPDNQYNDLDSVYNEFDNNYDDVQSFLEFIA